jgi:hypothetical protein
MIIYHVGYPGVFVFIAPLQPEYLYMYDEVQREGMKSSPELQVLTQVKGEIK